MCSFLGRQQRRDFTFREGTVCELVMLALLLVPRCPLRATLFSVSSSTQLPMPWTQKKMHTIQHFFNSNSHPKCSLVTVHIGELANSGLPECVLVLRNFWWHHPWRRDLDCAWTEGCSHYPPWQVHTLKEWWFEPTIQLSNKFVQFLSISQTAAWSTQQWLFPERVSTHALRLLLSLLHNFRVGSSISIALDVDPMQTRTCTHWLTWCSYLVLFGKPAALHADWVQNNLCFLRSHVTAAHTCKSQLGPGTSSLQYVLAEIGHCMQYMLTEMTGLTCEEVAPIM